MDLKEAKEMMLGMRSANKDASLAVIDAILAIIAEIEQIKEQQARTIDVASKLMAELFIEKSKNA